MAGEIGTRVSPDALASYGEVRLTAEPLRLAEWILFLGEIREPLPFEGPAPGTDPYADDTGLVLVTDDGLGILSGNVHAGICSTVAQVQRLTGDDRVRDVVGGFHLLESSDDRVGSTVSFLAALAPVSLQSCHCTDLATRCAFRPGSPDRRGRGRLVLEYA